MTNLHLIYGFAGAGKTTFARKLETDISAIRFTHDEWMVKLYGNNPEEQKFSDYYERISDLIWNLTMQLLSVKSRCNFRLSASGVENLAMKHVSKLKLLMHKSNYIL